jgi:signal transduction histidine kinase
VNFHRSPAVVLGDTTAGAVTSQRPAIIGLEYVAAVLAVAIGTVLTIAVRPWMGGSISIFFFPVIVISAIYGGYGPALCATVLSTASMAYFLVPPYNSFDIGTDDVLRLFVFALVAVATASLSSARKRADDAQRKAVGELKQALDTLTKVSDWPVFVDATVRGGVHKLLEHAATVVRAASSVVAWEFDDEPWIYVARYSQQDSGLERYSPSELTAIVPDELADYSFVSGSSGGDELEVVVAERGTTWRGRPAHPHILLSLGTGGFASAGFHVEHLKGRAFFGGLTEPSPAMMPLVELVARETGNSLDHLYMQERLRQLAVREDRIRVARDLHDGVLQSLTGIRYQLQALAEPPVSSEVVSSRLLAVERALAIEQRELRQFIDDLKPAPRPATPDGSLAHRLAALRERLAADWKTPIIVRVTPDGLVLSPELDRAAGLMVHEAIVNALKHARASRVVAEICADGDGALRIEVSDDGCGFSFRGRFDHDALVAGQIGPVSLRERVESVGGTLAIDSRATGSRVEIAVPLALSRPA